MSYTPRLKYDYNNRIIASLKESFSYKSVMQVPKLLKIVLSRGVGSAVADKKLIDHAIEELSIITGQKAIATVSKKDVGTSIAINGVCLTLIHFKKSQKCYDLQFDISPETLRVANLKKNKVGDLFNIEKSLKYGDEIAGHFVQGHVDTTIKLINIERQKDSAEFTFEKINSISDFIVEKGSICLDGISLTIAKNNKNNFKIALIPHTLEVTNWKYIEVGDMVNVEIDMMAKYIKNFMDLR